MTWRRSKGAYSATHTKPHQEAWPRLAYTKRRATKETNSLTNELTHKRSNLKSSIKYMERPTQRVLLHIYMDLSLSLSLSLLPSLSLALFSANQSPRHVSSLLSSPLTPSPNLTSVVSLHPRHRCPKEKYLPSALMLLRVLLEGEKVPSEPLTRRELRLAGSCDSQTSLVRVVLQPPLLPALPI